MDTTQPNEAVVDAPVTETPATEDTAPEQTLEGALYGDDQPDESAEEPEATDEEPESEEEAEAEESEADPIPAPLSWKKEEQEQIFAKLPREAQEVIARREAEGNRFIQAKAQEAAQARQQLTTEALQVVETLKQQQAEELENFAAQIVPQRPPHRLMAENPAEYAAQMEAFEYWTAQRQHAQQAAHQRRQEAQFIQQQQAQEAAALEAQQTEAILREQFPEYLDPNEGPKLRDELGALAIELGYPPERLQQVDAFDILAMKNLRNLKADADKWRTFQKQKMAGVRAAKDLPKLAKPGTPASAPKRPTDPVRLLYPND